MMLPVCVLVINNKIPVEYGDVLVSTQSSSSCEEDENVSRFLHSACRKLHTVSLTGYRVLCPVLRVVGEGGRLLTERWALIGWALLRAVTSHGGEARWCKITSPFMGPSGSFHSQERGEVLLPS